MPTPGCITHWFKMDTLILAADGGNPTGIDTIQDSVGGGFVGQAATNTGSTNDTVMKTTATPNALRVYLNMAKNKMTTDGVTYPQDTLVYIEYDPDGVGIYDIIRSTDPAFVRIPYGGEDYMTITSARSRIANVADGDPGYPAHAPNANGGNITFELTGIHKTGDCGITYVAPSRFAGHTWWELRPSRGGFGIRERMGGFTTYGYCPLTRRQDGYDYIFANVRRKTPNGSYMEHYIGWDGTNAGFPADRRFFKVAGDILLYDNTREAGLAAQAGIQMGHLSSSLYDSDDGTVGAPTCLPGSPSGGNYVTDWDSALDQPSDYYGAMIVRFDYGAPKEERIVQILETFLDDWRVGTKVAPAEWSQESASDGPRYGWA